MKSINASAIRTFRALTNGLDVGQSRRVDNTPGYMHVSVERLSEHRYSLAHYYEQNGDLCADPDVVFCDQPDGKVYPYEITQAPVGRYARYAEFSDDGVLLNLSRRLQADLASFCNTWLKNIRDQQGLGAARSCSRSGRA